MNNWFTRIFSSTPKDELVGRWTNEDGSGISMMHSTVYDIKEDGTGMHYGSGSRPTNTGNDEEEYFDEIPFTWKRINKNTIELIFDGKHSTLQYTITPFQSYTTGHELTQTGGNTLWFYGSYFRF